MTTPVIAIIGAGIMGYSLISGLINNNHPPNKLWASDTDEEKLSRIANDFHIHITNINKKAVEHANIVIFALKPQVFAQVLSPLKETFIRNKPLIISIAAGIRESHIQGWIGKNSAIVRAMPNTPALINCGATALFANTYVTHEQRRMAESILRCIGKVVWIEDEKLMDVVTALSGNGPAYFFLIMEVLQHAAEELGLPPEIAHLLTLETALGSARMALESGKSLAELRQNVTSPGGTTEKAISVLEENNIRGLFQKTLLAGKCRSEELGNLTGEKK